MTWRRMPGIKTHGKDGVLVVRITGDLLLDMPNAWRQEALDRLFALRHSEKIVVDLRDIGRVSSWGEQRIKSLVRTAGQASVAADPARSAMYAGLSVELGTLDPPVRLRGSLEPAVGEVLG